MLRIQAVQFGEPDVLVASEVPNPVAGSGQVVVEVSVADTLHLDTVPRCGAFPFPVVEPPYVPGGGVAGEVVAVGPGVEWAAWAAHVPTPIFVRSGQLAITFSARCVNASPLVPRLPS